MILSITISLYAQRSTCVKENTKHTVFFRSIKWQQFFVFIGLPILYFTFQSSHCYVIYYYSKPIEGVRVCSIFIQVNTASVISAKITASSSSSKLLLSTAPQCVILPHALKNTSRRESKQRITTRGRFSVNNNNDDIKKKNKKIHAKICHRAKHAETVCWNASHSESTTNGWCVFLFQISESII